MIHQAATGPGGDAYSILRRRSAVGAVLCLAVGLAPPAAFSSGERAQGIVNHVDAADGWDALDILWNGSPAEKELVAEEMEELLPYEHAGSPAWENTLASMVDSLLAYLDSEPDEWIRYKLLWTLAEVDEPFIRPLFLRALHDPSPNIRWVGILHYSTFTTSADSQDIEALHELWEQEERPWVRRALIRAFGRQESSLIVEDLLAVAGGDDEELANTALWALERIGDPDAIPALVRLASTAPESRLSGIISALSNWEQHPDVFPLLLEMTHHAEPSLRLGAVYVLWSSRHPALVERVVEMAHEDPVVHLRIVALELLDEITHPGLVTLLQQIVATSESRESPVAECARHLLWMHEGSGLRLNVCGTECDSAHGSDGWQEITDRERRSEIQLRVAPAGGFRSARSYPAPGRLVGPRGIDTGREDAGTLIPFGDYYELDGQLWIGLWSWGCWLRSADIARGTFEDYAPPDAGEDGLLTVDHDLPEGETESEVALQLLEAGYLELFDPGEGVIGAALTVDPLNREDVLFLLACHERAPRELSLLLKWTLGRLDDHHRNDETLAPLLSALD